MAVEVAERVKGCTMKTTENASGCAHCAKLEQTISTLRAAMETTRLYVKDDMIAHAVTLEGMSLIETIDTALEQRMKDETNGA